MQPAKINYKIYQGSTFQEIYRWESQTKVYVPITQISRAAPCVITAPTHGLPVGWRFRVAGAGGMKELNSVGENTYIASNTTQDTITINQVNSLGYTAYTSGGVVEYNQPVPLNTYSARMQIRESVDSDAIIYYGTSESNGDLEVNNTLKTIKIQIPANITQDFVFTTAVYSVELYEPGGIVVPFLTGSLTLVQEITR
jgi:osmotically-inducible protein OsmY